MTTYEFIRALHYAIGVLALLCFWTSAFSRKGSPLHKRVGKIYLLTMVGILLTSIPLVTALLWNGRIFNGSFLAYLFVITSTSLWLSWRAIRDKRQPTRYFGRVYQTLAVINLLAGGAVLALGLSKAQLVFAAFSLVGLLNGVSMLRNIRNPPTHPQWWLREHLAAMGGNGIATHIAFSLIGLPKLLPAVNAEWLNIAGWIGPLVIGVVGISWASRKYLQSK
jgi:uncharacterized membrane protein